MISAFGHEFFPIYAGPKKKKGKKKGKKKRKEEKRRFFLKTPARLPLKSDAWGVKKVFPPTRRGKRDSICPLVARMQMRNKAKSQRKSRFLHEILPDFAIFFGANFLHFPSYFKCVCAFFAFCALFALWIFAFTLALINDFWFWSRFFPNLRWPQEEKREEKREEKKKGRKKRGFFLKARARLPSKSVA